MLYNTLGTRLRIWFFPIFHISHHIGKSQNRRDGYDNQSQRDKECLSHRLSPSRFARPERIDSARSASSDFFGGWQRKERHRPSATAPAAWHYWPRSAAPHLYAVFSRSNLA